MKTRNESHRTGEESGGCWAGSGQLRDEPVVEGEEVDFSSGYPVWVGLVTMQLTTDNAHLRLMVRER